MEIENEGKNSMMNTIDEEENNGEQQKRTRGRRKKQNQGWEETIEVILPNSFNRNKDHQPKSKEQKGGKKKKQSVEMEIEEYGSGCDNYRDIVKQMQKKQGHFDVIFNLSEYYNMQIDTSRSDIQRENFEHLIGRVTNIIEQKMVELPNFLNYIQLLIEKSHLDLLIDFNKQLDFDIQQINDESDPTIHIINYSGGNQLFKILTYFKNEIEDMLDMILNSQKKSKPHTILCLFDGAYNISKQDMIDIGKFFSEEYEQFSNLFQIVILFPLSQLISVPDIQIYTIEFCKSNDLFVKFLLFLLKQEEYPPLPLGLLRKMLCEFDLYQITYNEQVRRIKLAISTYLLEHQKDEQLIKLLSQMKEYAQQRLAGSEEEDENKSDEEEQKTNKSKRSKSNKIKMQKNSNMKDEQKNIIIEKVDLWNKKKEIKGIILFLESLYRCNFSSGVQNDFNSFSQSVIDQNHRMIEIILNKDKRYIMPPNQQDDFLKDPNLSCKLIKKLIEDVSEEGTLFPNVFKSHIQTLKEIDIRIKEDLEKMKKANISKMDRVAIVQQSKALSQSSNTPQQIAIMKKEKVESIVKQITDCIHHTFNALDIPKLSLDASILNAQCRPDILGSLMTHLNVNDPSQIKHNNRKKLQNEIVANNTDGMNLLLISQQCGRNIIVSEIFSEYKSFLRENNIENDDEKTSASFYNAICELRFLGLIEEKRKLRNDFVKHFFAKSSFSHLCIGNN